MDVSTYVCIYIYIYIYIHYYSIYNSFQIVHGYRHLARLALRGVRSETGGWLVFNCACYIILYVDSIVLQLVCYIMLCYNIP